MFSTVRAWLNAFWMSATVLVPPDQAMSAVGSVGFPEPLQLGYRPEAAGPLPPGLKIAPS